MKNYHKSIPVFLFSCLLLCSLSCKKDDAKKEAAYTCTSCKTSADAKAENNTSSKGVYKGVVVGSTGTILIDILNSGATLSGILTLDGAVVNLTSTGVWVSGQPFTVTFTGSAGGQNYSFMFSVGATGSDPSMSAFNIPGHPNILAQIFKETSDNLIKSYEGTTTGVKDNGNAQSSILNVVTSGKTNTWVGLSRDNNSSQVNLASGTITGTTLSCDCGPNTTVTGTITADEIKGTYKGQDNHGTFQAKRTL